MSEQFRLSMTAAEIDEALLNIKNEIKEIDFSRFDTGEDTGVFTEKVGEKIFEHIVYFETVNGVRRPYKIDNCIINWGDSE